MSAYFSIFIRMMRSFDQSSKSQKTVGSMIENKSKPETKSKKNKKGELLILLNIMFWFNVGCEFCWSVLQSLFYVLGCHCFSGVISTGSPPPQKQNSTTIDAPVEETVKTKVTTVTNGNAHDDVIAANRAKMMQKMMGNNKKAASKKAWVICIVNYWITIFHE